LFCIIKEGKPGSVLQRQFVAEGIETSIVREIALIEVYFLN
jgi:hypothetical protein